MNSLEQLFDNLISFSLYAAHLTHMHIQLFCLVTSKKCGTRITQSDLTLALLGRILSGDNIPLDRISEVHTTPQRESRSVDQWRRGGIAPSSLVQFWSCKRVSRFQQFG